MPGGYVDLHHHLLHGMDDGPQSFRTTARMLSMAAEAGVTHIAATPHIYLDAKPHDAARYKAHMEMAQRHIQAHDLGITLHTGAEIYYSSLVPALLQQNRLPLLGDSWHVLVEFHPHESYDVIRHAAQMIGNAGRSMLLAHAERYRCLRLGRRLEELRHDLHVHIQVNCSTLLGSRLLDRSWLNRIMREELVDVVASDAHSPDIRPCRMGECAALIERTWGKGAMQRLCIENPYAILTERQAFRL